MHVAAETIEEHIDPDKSLVQNLGELPIAAQSMEFFLSNLQCVRERNMLL